VKTPVKIWPTPTGKKHCETPNETWRGPASAESVLKLIGAERYGTAADKHILN